MVAKMGCGLTQGVFAVALLSAVAVCAQAGPVDFGAQKVVATASDGASRTWTAASMDADSFAELRYSSDRRYFGFEVLRNSEANAYPYAGEVFIVGPTTELRLTTDTSVLSWTFAGKRRARLCAGSLHGHVTPNCNIYQLPE